MSTFRRSRTDASHKECIQAAHGVFPCVVDTHEVNNFCDFVAGGRGRAMFIEVKNPKKPPSARLLTDGERDFARRMSPHAEYVVVGCAHCVYAILGGQCAKCAVAGPHSAQDYDRETRTRP
jgi:hypothetical protein